MIHNKIYKGIKGYKQAQNMITAAIQDNNNALHSDRFDKLFGNKYSLAIFGSGNNNQIILAPFGSVLEKWIHLIQLMIEINIIKQVNRKGKIIYLKGGVS